MNGITETVELPDPAVQPLVHPLDLPEARRDFRFAFWIRALTNPGTALVLAALTWFLNESWVLPVVVFVILAVIGHFAAAWSDRQAWGFIPRKRRDDARRLPFSWLLGRALIFASLLAVGLALVTVRLSTGSAQIADGVNEYVVAMGAVAAAMSLVVFVVQLVRGPDRRAIAFSLPPIVAVVASVIFAAWVLFRDDAPSWPDLRAGALIMFAAGVIVGVGRLVEQRRSPAGA